MKVVKIILFAFILLSLTSCTKVLMTLFGIRNARLYSEKEILKEAKKQNIPTDNLYVLDTEIINFFNSLDTSDKKIKLIIKDHYQPCQAIYYNQGGEVISFHNNCNSTRFRSIWNSEGAFNKFPPETAAPLDTIFNFIRLMDFIHPLNKDQILIEPSKYVSIVYFNRMMRGRNRRLVKEVQMNAVLASEDSLQVIYVNTDEFIYKFFGEEEKVSEM